MHGLHARQILDSRCCVVPFEMLRQSVSFSSPRPPPPIWTHLHAPPPLICMHYTRAKHFFFGAFSHSNSGGSFGHPAGLALGRLLAEAPPPARRGMSRQSLGVWGGRLWVPLRNFWRRCNSLGWLDGKTSPDSVVTVAEFCF